MTKKSKTLPAPWLFNGQPFTSEDLQKTDFEGFVYLIIEKATGKKYIGKKSFYSTRKVKGKARRQTSESDWESYFSSSDEIKRLVRLYGHDAFERHIISLHLTFGDAGFNEVRLQFVYNVLEDENFFNDAINKWKGTTKRIREGREISHLTF
jgi:hypothetical protein